MDLDPARRAQLEQLQRRIGYVFRNIRLLDQAFRHQSASSSWRSCYEDFENHGDRLLAFLFNEIMAERLPCLSLSERQYLSQAILSNKFLEELCYQLHLAEFIAVGESGKNRQGLKRKIPADVIEALVYAIRKDGGFEQATHFVARILVPPALDWMCVEKRSRFRRIRAFPPLLAASA